MFIMAVTFRFYEFTILICLPTSGPSGGSIFRCTTKDRGERRAKGVATPFNPLGLMRDRKPDVLCAYLLATVHLTRLSRLRRCRLFPRLCVLRCGGKVCTPATTRLPNSRNAGYSLSANDFAALGAVGKSPAEAVLAAMKLSQKGGAWLSGGAVQSEHHRHAVGRA